MEMLENVTRRIVISQMRRCLRLGRKPICDVMKNCRFRGTDAYLAGVLYYMCKLMVRWGAKMIQNSVAVTKMVGFEKETGSG